MAAGRGFGGGMGLCTGDTICLPNLRPAIQARDDLIPVSATGRILNLLHSGLPLASLLYPQLRRPYSSGRAEAGRTSSQRPSFALSYRMVHLASPGTEAKSPQEGEDSLVSLP
jgi:hypothetical protein